MDKFGRPRKVTNRMQNIFSLLLFIFFSLPLCAKDDDFSAAEQQQVNIETPGLFDRTTSFKTDFTNIRNTEYSFPLPVGKVISVTNGVMEIETKKGDAVKAMFDGTARLVRSNTIQNGNVIVLRHDNGMETVYSFNSVNMVKVGQKVKAGQTIAIVGTEGGRAVCKMSIMVNGCRINPETILDTQTHTLYRQMLTFKKNGSHVDVSTTRWKGKGKNTNTNDKKEVATTSNLSKYVTGAPDPQEMSMDTNNPFGDNAVYRLDLDRIKSWHYPLDDSHVISDYGGARGHSGVDIKNAPNKDIYAVFDGLVVQSGNFSGYGKCITIRHANGLETRYSHNNKNYVNVGDQVKAGQVIGITGRTGRATTEHLHFETRINGRAFNPAYVFDHVKHCLCSGILQFKKGGSVVRLNDDGSKQTGRK